MKLLFFRQLPEVNVISVQHDDFSVASEYQRLNDCNSDGALVTFVGKVRDLDLGRHVTGLTLEHYPGMTEKALCAIADEAKQRWSLTNVRVIHRVGRLDIGDQIVFIGVSSAHRKAAFEACEFIMDYLKTRAPFWKKERVVGGEHWVEAKDSDTAEAARW